MIFVIVFLIVVSIAFGIVISIKAFGTGGKRAEIFDDIYFSFEDVDNIGIVYTKNGDYSAILSMENPVRKFSTDKEGYYNFTTLMASVLQTLGEGYAVQKQDLFIRRKFEMSNIFNKESDSNKNFLSKAYFRFFDGRPYTDCMTYLIITQHGKKGTLHTYESNKWRDFLVKIQKVHDRLKSEQVTCRFLQAEECRQYAEHYLAIDFRNKNIAINDFNVTEEHIGMGDETVKVYSLLDVDEVGLPGRIKPYADITVNNSVMSEDLLSTIDHLPNIESVFYNQVIILPNQKREIMSLEKKCNRHASIPNPNNQLAVEDIKAVLNDIARNGKQLVYAHYSLVIKVKNNIDIQKVTNSLENLLARYSMSISKRAYNQLELYVASFPGNSFQLNSEYDRFLTLSEPAICLMYKERQQKGDEHSKLKCYYTDRQGMPLPVDVTGKEGAIRYTDNSNFFVLGPSGSGKSFFMNTVIRQYYEQNTDVVIVDTGDSYEGLCSYFEGTYITYSKESPISMNPFKIKKEEYEGNFEEKKDFLKNLIFLIFKGSELPTKLEDTIINQTILEYYEAYFNPFTGFTKEERENLKDILLLEDKKNGEYDKFVDHLQETYDDTIDEEEIKKEALKEVNEENQPTERDLHLKPKLEAFLQDQGASDGEKEAAKKQLQIRHLTPQVIEGKYLQRIKKKIDRIERQKKALKVTELSFNSYYEFALERIPQITKQQQVTFKINEFATILKPFYKGGEYENTLNNDMDAALFDERFIVFEIDNIKDNPVLFPIIVLIIMDVFTQKMRLKNNCRKCLVIEEAWKAIATPVMANYIKYLYKTARKHWAMVGVVTQDIEDIISSDVVKNAIISNSGVFMLLDQSKFKDKFDDIKSTLALTDIDCKKIFTINRLENKDGRSPFKEVFIKRGQDGEVFGIEEPPECYMSYTTEKAEKTALKLYKRLLHCNHQKAIEAFCRDWKLSGIKKSFDFANKVLEEGKVFNFTKQQNMK